MAYLDNYIKARNHRLRHGKQKPLRQIVEGDRRKHVINAIMDTLRDWRDSPFEHEGACVAGIRSALCLDGHSWAPSDMDARQIVVESLKLMGAQRPEWDEGQLGYTEQKDHCIWCSGPISQDERGRQRRFCSLECAKSARVHREGEWSQRVSSTARSAAAMLRGQKNDPVSCLYCGVSFIPHSGHRKIAKYCSRDCDGKARRTIPEKQCPHCLTTFYSPFRDKIHCSSKCARTASRTIPMRECKTCGVTFRPTARPQTFCSRDCSDAARSRAVYPKKCEWCDKSFMAASTRARFCNDKCQIQSYQERKG